ncbi:MAG: beta-Ala-His dipeptidase [Peptoniphilaceae bacterium]|nr:beta-Ala-His dipeptidase [Peptoniphilaceae bacterium]
MEIANYPEHPVFQHFYDLNQVPRCSDHVEAIGEALMHKADAMGLSAEKDAAGNVRIVRLADPAYANAPRVIIQGHMDMVCVQSKESKHDFTCEPIEMEVRDGWLRAKGTTLGADDGIGLAMGLALLEEVMPLPEVQVLATTNEETGMDGALGISPEWLDADMLVNIDSEEEGFVTCGCAGGATGEFKMPLEREMASGLSGLALTVTGMRGGHSGTSILSVPHNAAKVMAEWIRAISHRASIRLFSFHSGEKHNAIPNEAQAVIGFAAEEREAVIAALDATWEEILGRILKQEPDVSKQQDDVALNDAPLTDASMKALLSLVELMPHGVYKMHEDEEKGVVASDNLAIVSTQDAFADIMVSVRSSDPAVGAELESKIAQVLATFEGTGEYVDRYPAWALVEDSPLRELLKDVYRDQYGEEVVVKDIHAGLECGMFAEKNPRLDMISIGPDMEGVHTAAERLNIDSTLRTYELLKKLMERVATKA